MPKSPTCANCGRPMIETARSAKRDGDWEVSVFECSGCGIDFFTEDHVPLTGLPAFPRVGARFIAAMRHMVHGRTSGDLIDSEATQLLKAHGDQACEVVRRAARMARNKRDHKQARHLAHVALRIVELEERLMAR